MTQDVANVDMRAGILELMDGYVRQILSICKMVMIVFASSIVLGPPSIVLSLYLFAHPSFERTLEANDNFGEVLQVLLVSTVAVASILVIFGTKQYKSIGSWDKRFNEYLAAQSSLEKGILRGYDMSDD